MRPAHATAARKRLLAGLVIIAGGCLLLLNNLGVIGSFSQQPFWPLMFMLFGGLLLAKGGPLRRKLSAGLLFGLGLLMTLDHNGVLRFSLQQWWPIFLIYAGLMLLLPRTSRAERKAGEHWFQASEAGKEIRGKLLMSGSELRSDRDSFTGGELSLVMSGLKLDLREAQLNGKAELKVEMMLAGLELRIPPDWQVEIALAPVMGAVENKSTPPRDGSKLLVLRGEMLMSGIEIRN